MKLKRIYVKKPYHCFGWFHCNLKNVIPSILNIFEYALIRRDDGVLMRIWEKELIEF